MSFRGKGKKVRRETNTTRAVNVFRAKKDGRNNQVYCTIRIIFYYILIICCFFFFFFYSKYHFFYHWWYRMGGREQVGEYLCKTTGWIYVSMWFYFPSSPLLCPVFVTEACTHSSLLRSCPDVFLFFIFFLLLFFFL